MALQEEFVSEGNVLFKYRSYLPILLLVVAIAVYCSDPQPINENLFLAGLIVSLVGLVIRIHIVGHTPKNTSGRNTKEGQVADVLNTTGFYSVLRHPLYLGNFFMYMGFAIITGNVWFIVSCVLIFWLYYERIMAAEENFLRGKFSNDYLLWSGNTPAFVPKLSNWEKPSIPFSWKKVLKKEKNGLLATFAVFYIMLSLKNYFINGNPKPPFDWMFYATAASAIVYFILKLIKNNTNYLDEEDR